MSKLTEKQQKVIETLQQYPNERIMLSGTLTGGHGIKFDMRTVQALYTKGLLLNGKIKQ